MPCAPRFREFTTHKNGGNAEILMTSVFRIRPRGSFEDRFSDEFNAQLKRVTSRKFSAEESHRSEKFYSEREGGGLIYDGCEWGYSFTALSFVIF